MFYYPPQVHPMGETAFLIDLGAEIDEAVNARVHALADALEGTAGVVETIPGFASLLVRFDPAQVSHQGLREYISRALDAPTPELPAATRVIQIPTHYGGEFGPDLEFVAQHSHLSAEQVIRLHTGRPFRVFMLGFAPGFPYAGPLPPEIAAPRLETPRDQVPAGSVGIAGRQTGIYSRASPGGWRLIGRTDIRLFDPASDPPTLLKPGDLLRFIQVLT